MSYDEFIICGSVAFDEIMDFPSYFVKYLNPDMLHQINVSFVVDRLEKQLGGTATNIAYGTRLLTSKKISVLSAIGKDGHEFKSFFKKNKIMTNLLSVDNRMYTATGKVITDKNDNQIWGYYHGALEQAANIDLTKHLKAGTLVILSATAKSAFISHLDQLTTKDIDFIFDPGMTLTWINRKTLIKGINACKYLIGNDYEIESIKKTTQVNIKDLLTKGVCIITTLGYRGVRYQSEEFNIEVPGFIVTDPVDPTGAGDAFRGGFIASLLEKKDVKEALIWGNALASFTIEKYGTVTYRPSHLQLSQRTTKIRNSIKRMI